MLSHFLCQRTHADTCEIVDRKPDVSRIFSGEETLKILSKHVVTHSRLELGHTHLLYHVLEQNLDEDAATGGSLFFAQMDG